MPRRLAAAALFLLLLLAAAPVPARAAAADEEIPAALRWMIHPYSEGMWIFLPAVDTDPNRGPTAGIMPVRVRNRGGDGDILSIFAPGLTYNELFGWMADYRYFRYPRPGLEWNVTAGIGENRYRGLYGYLEDEDFLGRGAVLTAESDYYVDGSYRFYGIGPDTPRGDESDYTLDMWTTNLRCALPLTGNRAPLRLQPGLAFRTMQPRDGILPGLPDSRDRFPAEAAIDRLHELAWGLAVVYDSRDERETPRTGAYARAAYEISRKNAGSRYGYNRYLLDLRRFIDHRGDGGLVTAARMHAEYLDGRVPFWSLPGLGGKTSHRGFGEGRYRDQGSWTAGIEERWRFLSMKFTGVDADFNLDPFVELGTVFGRIDRFAVRYLRPAAGAALRAVVRPQVVGSIDVAFAREGASVFVDIRYSY